MTVGVRDWLKAVREYPAKNQELNELRELLAHSESQLQIGEQKCRQLEDICLAQKRDVKQVEQKLEGCMNALRLFGPKLDTPELLEQFYAAVMPTMDRDGFRLYSTAAKMTGFNPYDVFSYEDTPHIMSYKDLTLDLDGYKVYSSEGNIELTPREFEILRELLNHKGRILTRQNFLQTLWKYEFFGDERIIDTHIKNLRKKLGTVDYIETIRGVGYRIDKEDKE